MNVGDAGAPPGSTTVLVLGAQGFLGIRIAQALEDAGFAVVRGARPAMDLARDLDPGAWSPRLEGIGAVVNAAGIVRESGGTTFELVHALGPAALFKACAERRIPVVQISALGADAQAQTGFHRSKRAGDAALLALDVPALVLQPSLVFGSGGASARLFSMLASLPLIPLPGSGEQAIQPVHVDDVAEAVVRAVRGRVYPRARIAAVGPRPTTLREFLGVLRAGLGLGRARFLRIPEALVGLPARLRVGLLDRDTWSMLRRGNTADVTHFRELLGRDPLEPARFITAAESRSQRTQAQLAWLLPLLRVSVAAVWIVTGVVSAGLYPVDESLALLARVGLNGTAGVAALYGAAVLDFAIGIAILTVRRRRMLWLLQLAVIVGYTALITIFLPEQWLHPYGPILKNLPMLAAIVLLHQLEER